jgi:CheY-like chemotaxis protein
MPQMDGVSLLSALKQDKTIPMPKFVFITGGVHLDLSKLDIDCDGTILKPYDEDELFTLLHQLLSIKPA